MTLGIVVLVGILAIPVFGWTCGGRGQGDQDHGYCQQHGKGYGNLTEEQRNELDKHEKTFLDNTAKFRNEMRIKKRKFNTLLNSAEPDPEQLKALQKEINELKGKIAEHRIDFVLQARKIAPNCNFGLGYGKGKGKGKGKGGHKRGHGPHGAHGAGTGPPME